MYSHVFKLSKSNCYLENKTLWRNLWSREGVLGQRLEDLIIINDAVTY